MCSHEEKNCPRCQALFICKPGDIIRCQCFEIWLSSEERAFIEERYSDCLCRNCLEDLKKDMTHDKSLYELEWGKGFGSRPLPDID
jgi:hypothetical protein